MSMHIFWRYRHLFLPSMFGLKFYLGSHVVLWDIEGEHRSTWFMVAYLVVQQCH